MNQPEIEVGYTAPAAADLHGWNKTRTAFRRMMRGRRISVFLSFFSSSITSRIDRDEWTWKRLASQRDSPGDISGERWKNSRVMDVS